MDLLKSVEKSKFNWKIFIASSIFFFAVLVNPRDFPIPRVPLIYPAFLFFVLLIGTPNVINNVIKGFRRTKFLCFLLITYWSYMYTLNLIMGKPIGLERSAYLIEPLLIFCAAGMATMRPGGTKAALWALISIITFSTACGIWLYFIGEPFSSLYKALQSSTGSNNDIIMDSPAISKFNAGLSRLVFLFSYQLAVATLMTLAIVLSMKKSSNIKKLLLWLTLVILLIGIITNAERATVLSIFIGLTSFFFIKRTKTLNFKAVISFIFFISILFALFNYSYKWEDKYTLGERAIKSGEIHVRGMVIPIAAISSVFFDPLGAGGTSNYYADFARKVGWVSYDGYSPIAPHNHFANVIMYTGIIGIFLTILLFRGVWKKIHFIRLSKCYDEKFILGIACITLIVHSLTHNAGFFSGGYETNIVFGLLWGSTSKHYVSELDSRLKEWIFMMEHIEERLKQEAPQ